jgi:hypothetical protein
MRWLVGLGWVLAWSVLTWAHRLRGARCCDILWWLFRAHLCAFAIVLPIAAIFLAFWLIVGLSFRHWHLAVCYTAMSAHFLSTMFFASRIPKK